MSSMSEIFFQKYTHCGMEVREIKGKTKILETKSPLGRICSRLSVNCTFLQPQPFNPQRLWSTDWERKRELNKRPARKSASSMRWVVSTMTRSALRRFNIIQTDLRLTGSNPAVGSSRNIIYQQWQQQQQLQQKVCIAEWVRFSVPLDTLQVITETVLQASTCNGTDNKN